MGTGCEQQLHSDVMYGRRDVHADTCRMAGIGCDPMVCRHHHECDIDESEYAGTRAMML